MRRSVVTLDRAGVAAACRRLESLCAGVRPDLIVGIASGGVGVARWLFPSAAHGVIGTPGLSRLKGRWFSRLPVSVLDALRVVELRLRRRKPKSALPEVSDELKEMAGKARCILVVDDAVDSGATLQAAMAAMKAAAPDARVLSAVLTSTGSNPLARPDFCCFPEGTILRFPWSVDAKG